MTCIILVGKPLGKQLSGRLRQRLGDNFEIDVKEISCSSADLSGPGGEFLC